VRGVNVPDLQEGNRHRQVSWSRREDRHVYEWKLDVESWGDGEVQVDPGRALGLTLPSSIATLMAHSRGWDGVP
jgi:hypothetical protein